MKKMILKIVLFLSCGMLVSSNNGYPVIPTQTYPIYQQNGYTNPSANQPDDITPYLQRMMVQNQSPSMNLSPTNIRQILLNRILSNQPIQTIFDQNTVGYGSNLIEYRNNPVAFNPVNNNVNAQPISANKDDTTVDIKTEEKRKKTKKRKSKKSKRKHRSEKNQNTSNQNEVDDVQDKEKEISKQSKKRSRKSKTKDSPDHTRNSENESNKNTKKKKRKNKNSEVKKTIDKDTVEDNPKPRRRHKKKPKIDQSNTEKEIKDEQTSPKPYQILEGINFDHFNEGIVEENRVPRNPIPDGNNLLKSIPNLPENIANSFNFKGLPQFNNPAMSNFFGNYENIYQSMMSNNKGNNQREIKKIRPQISRNSNKRKSEVKNRNATTTTNATILTSSKPTVKPKINVVTTEKNIYIKEKTETNIELVPKEETFNKQFEANETNLRKFEYEEFEVEHDDIKDNEPNINDNYSYGYFEDYYPQFADSAVNTANNKEVYVKNLGDTKYYYAVDKGNPDFINRMRFESFGFLKNIVKDYDVNKTYDDAEKKATKKALNSDSKEEVVQFRSPPHLELPDFQTRKVEPSEINPERNYYFDNTDDFDSRFKEDKASTYSEAKIPHYPGNKENNKKTPKDKPKDVETLFAKSKVVNYGPVYHPEEDSTSETSNPALTDNSDFKDGGTTYVLATSLDYPEYS